MYYRVNDQIVEGYRATAAPTNNCGTQIPVWVLVILFLLLLFAIVMAFKYLGGKGGRKSSSSRK